MVVGDLSISARNPAASQALSATTQDGGVRQPSQQGQRWCEFVRLSRHEQEVEQPSGRIADTDQLGAKAATRPTQCFAAISDLANESQTQRRSLPGRAPDAF